MFPTDCNEYVLKAFDFYKEETLFIEKIKSFVKTKGDFSDLQIRNALSSLCNTYQLRYECSDCYMRVKK